MSDVPEAGRRGGAESCADVRKLGSQECQRCPNCGSAAPSNYCAFCGQEQEQWIVPASTWLRTVVQETTNVDGKLIQTIRTLLTRPGRLTEAWVLGHRRQFLAPVRLYLLASAMVFGLFALPGLSVGSDAFKGGIQGFLAGRFEQGQAPPDLERIARNPAEIERVSTTVARSLPRAMFVLLPFSALLLKVLVTPRRMYVVHAVFALHVHSALYLVIACFALLNPLRGAAKYVVSYPLGVVALLWAVWYVPAAYSKVHRTSLLEAVAVLSLWTVAYLPMFLATLFLLSWHALRHLNPSLP
jgi:hypothetical protein